MVIELNNLKFELNRDQRTAMVIGRNEPQKVINIPSVIVYDDIEYQITFIGYNAFKFCKELIDIIIPNSIIEIECAAFYGCESLKEIIIPDSVTRVHGGVDMSLSAWGAFEECGNLKRVTISNSMTEIEDLTFRGCKKLTSIIIPDSITSIGEMAFERCSSLRSLIIPNNVTTIGYHAFAECSNLVAIIPDSVTEIVGNPFWRCQEVIYKNKKINASALCYISNIE